MGKKKLTGKTLARVLDYVENLFAPEDAIFRELRLASEGAGLPPISINAVEGRLIQLLLAASGARRAVEVGTLAGYSAIWIARALPPDGRLITVEKEAHRAEVARRLLERAGLAEKVEVREGEGLAVLAALPADFPCDALFLDADHANYPAYLDWARANLRPGGLIIADNAFWGGKVPGDKPGGPDLEGIREFNRRLADPERFTAIALPIRDGVAAAVLR